MGHHKKNTQNAPTPPPYPPFDFNNISKVLNNVDINSMSNTLNNMDLNQVMSVLSKAFTPSMNTSPGTVSNNLGSSTQNAVPADMPSSSPAEEYFNPLRAFNIPDNNQTNTSAQPPLSPELPPNDPTVMILNSLKPLLPPDKCTIIDNMIKIYGIKTVIDKIFPPSVQTINTNINSGTGKSEELPKDKTESAE